MHILVMAISKYLACQCYPNIVTTATMSTVEIVITIRYVKLYNIDNVNNLCQFLYLSN